MKKLSRFLMAVALLFLAYLLFWPVSIDPGAWTPPIPPELEGPFALNKRLAQVERIGQEAGTGPEDVAVDSRGNIYCGFQDGRILRWKADLSAVELFADSGGVPLGLHFDASGNLIVADAWKGLLSFAPDGTLTVLATEYDGVPFAFTDDVDIAEDGTMYFSDASWKFHQTHFVDDLVEHRPNGRLLAYHPDNGEVSLVKDQLYFANGVAVSPGQDFVLVVETGMYRILRHWISGERSGKTEVFIDNLPGFPDGVSTGTEGIFWVAIASPRDKAMDALLPHPLLRKVLMRLPKFLQPAPKRHSFVLGLNQAGELIHNLQDPAGAYAPITSVQEHGGHLYFGSILEAGFARIPKPEKAPS